MKTYKGFVTDLLPNQIFVFGSNTQGRHGKGAALIARQKFGAIYGQARGLQGQSYAIVTKDLTRDPNRPSISLFHISEQIYDLYEYASEHPELEFLVAYSGTGVNLNNYSNQQMADVFSCFPIPRNVVFEEKFVELLKQE